MVRPGRERSLLIKGRYRTNAWRVTGRPAAALSGKAFGPPLMRDVRGTIKPTWATNYLTVWPMRAILYVGGNNND